MAMRCRGVPTAEAESSAAMWSSVIPGRWMTASMLCLLMAAMLQIFAWSARAAEPAWVREAVRAIVSIHVFNDDQWEVKTGTGFFVVSEDGRLELITNYHVLDGGRVAFVRMGDNRARMVDDVLYANAERDLIIVSVNNVSEMDVYALTLAAALPSPGEDLFVVSPPWVNVEDYVRRGFLIEIPEESIEGFHGFFYMSADIVRGNSGSPVLTADGRVIGVASARYPDLPLSLAQRFTWDSRPAFDMASSVPYWQWGLNQRRARAEAHVQRALEFQAGGSVETALFFYRKAVEEDPDYGEAWFQVGLLSGGLGRYHDAIEAYENVLERALDEDGFLYADARYNLALELARIGEYVRSETLLRENLADEPTDARSAALLSALYSGGFDDAAAAREMLELVQRLDPARASLLQPYVSAGDGTNTARRVRGADDWAVDATVFGLWVFVFFVIGYAVRRLRRFLGLIAVLTTAFLVVAQAYGAPVRWDVPIAVLTGLSVLLAHLFAFLPALTGDGFIALIVISGLVLGVFTRHRFFALRTFIYPVVMALLFVGLQYVLDIDVFEAVQPEVQATDVFFDPTGPVSPAERVLLRSPGD